MRYGASLRYTGGAGCSGICQEQGGHRTQRRHDNPLLFCEDEAVISGGNFHGEPMALPFDCWASPAPRSPASPSAHRAYGQRRPLQRLTRFLTTEGGVNSGFMIVQYTAASMVSENKVFAHPACVDSIPSSANQEGLRLHGHHGGAEGGLHPGEHPVRAGL